MARLININVAAFDRGWCMGNKLALIVDVDCPMSDFFLLIEREKKIPANRIVLKIPSLESA